MAAKRQGFVSPMGLCPASEWTSEAGQVYGAGALFADARQHPGTSRPRLRGASGQPESPW